MLPGPKFREAALIITLAARVKFSSVNLCFVTLALVKIMAHYEEVNVHGYDEFCRAVSERKGKDIFAYFSGDKDEQGKSWCPDCVKGNLRNLILGYITQLTATATILTVLS